MMGLASVIAQRLRKTNEYLIAAQKQAFERKTEDETAE
jgi:hypothetical protein